MEGKKTVPAAFDNKVASMRSARLIFVIVPDMDSVYRKEEKKVYGDYASDVCGYFGFNVDCSDEQQIKRSREGISLAISKKWKDRRYRIFDGMHCG